MMKKHWKKGLALGLSFLMAFEAPAVLSSALSESYGAERTATVTATALNVRSGPGTGNSIVGQISNGTAVTVLGETVGSDGQTWYQIRFTGSSGASMTGYVSGTYLRFAASYSADADFEAYLNSQGFPESYRPALRELHAKYPQWVFTAMDTGLDWNEAVENESLVGRNLVSSSSISSWKSTADGAYDWGTSTWPGFDGSSWVAASEDIIRYYMDPRNFLNETYIFQFLLQSYDSSIHTREGLASLVSGTFLENTVYVSDSYAGVLSDGTSAGNSGSSQAGSSGGNADSSVGIGPGGDTATSGTGGSGNTSSETTGSSSAELTGPGSSQTGNEGQTGSSGNSDISIGEAPGLNVSSLEGSGSLNSGISVSPHQVQRVAATTIIRVGPDGSTTSTTGGTSSSGSTSSSGTGSRTASYVDILMQAAQTSGVSPYVLAAMILQEQGTNGSGGSISGNTGYYNYYNFEAYASNGMTAVERGLWYASQSGDYMRPWNSIDKAIIGGAVQYGQNYVLAGQNTFYLKKFNVQGSNLYKHQFMTNVQGAASEGAKMAEAYSDSMRQTALQFSIPVYQNMPADACALPTGDGSPNNKLSSISVEGFTLTPSFDRDTSTYDVTVNSSVSSVNLQASAIDSTAQVSGTGTVALSGTLTEAKILVTAANGSVREYTIRITRSDSGPAYGGTSGGGSDGQTVGPGSSGSTGTGSGSGPGQSSGSTGSSGSVSGPGGSNVTIVE